MKTFGQWVENAQTTNRLAMLVQQGVGGGDGGAMQALLKMVKDGLNLQKLRQIVAGYTSRGGKAQSAAKYLMGEMDDADGSEDREWAADKAGRSLSTVAEQLGKHGVPHDLVDALMTAVQRGNNHEGSDEKAAVPDRSREFMPLLVKIAEHLMSSQDEKAAKNAMIEILGTLAHFTDKLPTATMIMNKV